MEIIIIPRNQYKGSCNSCKNIIVEDDMYNLNFNGLVVRICKSCLYDLEEMIISARIKKDDAISEASEQ